MTNHHYIANAINAVGKADANQLKNYIDLGKAILELIGTPGVDSERAAVRQVMKLQQGDLAAEISTQLAESTLRLACLLAREEPFLIENGATSIKAARTAITARNNEGKPKAEKPPKSEPTPEVEEMRDAVGKLETRLQEARVRAERAESSLFEVIAERDHLKAIVAKAGNLDDIIAERDALRLRVESLSAIVAGQAAPAQHTTKATARKVKRPADLDPNDAAGCRKFLAAWTGTKQHKLSKKRDAYVVTSEVTGEQMATAKTPWEAVRAACAAIPNCDDAESFNAMLPDGSEIVANENGTASLYQNGAVVRAFPSARHAYEFAAQ